MEIGLCLGLPLGSNRLFQVIVQVFVWIVLRRIGREEKQPDSILVFLYPILYKFPVVDLEVVQNDVDFTRNILEQPLQKLDQLLLIHAFLTEQVMAEVKRYMQGWLNYYAIASMRKTMAEWDGWLRRRIRMYIWKQWKKPRTKYRNLLKLGIPEKYAWMAAMSRRGYWFTVETGAVKRAISNERLARAGFFDLSLAYESIQSACVGRAVYRTVRTVR